MTLKEQMQAVRNESLQVKEEKIAQAVEKVKKTFLEEQRKSKDNSKFSYYLIVNKSGVYISSWGTTHLTPSTPPIITNIPNNALEIYYYSLMEKLLSEGITTSDDYSYRSNCEQFCVPILINLS